MVLASGLVSPARAGCWYDPTLTLMQHAKLAVTITLACEIFKILTVYCKDLKILTIFTVYRSLPTDRAVCEAVPRNNEFRIRMKSLRSTGLD